jgi:hypothetical protein
MFVLPETDWVVGIVELKKGDNCSKCPKHYYLINPREQPFLRS